LFLNRPPRPFVVILIALALVVMACLPGCGPPAGQVSGKVTFEGKSVTEGRITFQSLAGPADEAVLESNGTYSIEKPLPVGEYKVTITPLVVRQQVDGKGPIVGVEKPAPDIPQKYRTIGTTDLRATVKDGKNQFNFDMKR
jgi:hypothetical protein